MKKEKASGVKVGMREIILKTANYFSDFESSKSIPFWCYEVKVPEELKSRVSTITTKRNSSDTKGMVAQVNSRNRKRFK